jgi:hypothetical protein
MPQADDINSIPSYSVAQKEMHWWMLLFFLRYRFHLSAMDHYKRSTNHRSLGKCNILTTSKIPLTVAHQEDATESVIWARCTVQYTDRVIISIA